MLLNIKRGTKTSVAIVVIRTVVIAIGDRKIVPINVATATTDNTIRTIILFLCPFIYITCKVVDVISTPFFSASCFNYFPRRILCIPMIAPFSRVLCNFSTSFNFRFNKPLQYRIIFCTKSQMTLNCFIILNSGCNLLGIIKIDVYPRHNSFYRLRFSC